MSEAIIYRRGLVGGALNNAINNAINNALPVTLKTEIIDTNQIWEVPSGIINNMVYVWIFGGGGSSGFYSVGDVMSNDYTSWSGGGGGGWMNNATLTLTQGTRISIIIGNGAVSPTSNFYGDSGGTTSFGTYLSANGGGGGYGGNGGNGGSGGGGVNRNNGGIGYQFGGGGGYRVKTGGSFGGNGGNQLILAENGINTYTWNNVIGETGQSGIGGGAYGGGGGYGGNGGKGMYGSGAWSGGGGGGYGCSGSDGFSGQTKSIFDYYGTHYMGGGGGGYGNINKIGQFAYAYGEGYGISGGQGGNGVCIIQYYTRG